MTLQSLQPCRVFCRILPGGKRPGRPVVPAPATLRCITRLLILSAPSEPAIFPAIRAEEGCLKASQERAVANHRRRLRERGLARYEVRGLPQDKQLVRELARRLASNGGCGASARRDNKGSMRAPATGRRHRPGFVEFSVSGRGFADRA